MPKHTKNGKFVGMRKQTKKDYISIYYEVLKGYRQQDVADRLGFSVKKVEFALKWARQELPLEDKQINLTDSVNRKINRLKELNEKIDAFTDTDFEKKPYVYMKLHRLAMRCEEELDRINGLLAVIEKDDLDRIINCYSSVPRGNKPPMLPDNDIEN